MKRNTSAWFASIVLATSVARWFLTGRSGTQEWSTYVTFYGFDDNDDGNPAHRGTGAILHAVVHTSADEDLGTYDQPGTMAADKHFLPPGTKVYVLACDATTSWKTPAWNAPRIGCARSHMLTCM
jgi:hypothetical protein